MGTKATVEEARGALRAFTRIGNEVRLPEKAAWRVSRIIRKLRDAVEDADDTTRKLFKTSGGVQRSNQLQVMPPVRLEGEDDADWVKRQEDHQTVLDKLSEDLKALAEEEIEINYDPIPLSMFKGEKTQVAPLDFADAGPFITDGDEKPEKPAAAP